MRAYNRIPVSDRDVYALWKAGYGAKELAAEWGVSPSAIRMAVKRQKAKWTKRKPDTVTRGQA